MRVTTQRQAKGFLGRSLDEFKRVATISLKGEGMRHATNPRTLADFREPEFPKDCIAKCDTIIGGFSTVNLDFQPPTTSPDPPPSENKFGHVKFHGIISNQLPTDQPDVHRTGFAYWRTKDRGYSMWGKLLWDVDMYKYLALRVKSDGRKYFVNLQTESIVYTDIHQHRLYAKRPGEWETILIKWSEFVRTNHGVVVEPQNEMLRQKLRTVGIGLIDRIPGPYELCIERMWATNGLGPEYHADERAPEDTHLTTKDGSKIKWAEDPSDKEGDRRR